MRITPIIICLLLLLTLAACGDKEVADPMAENEAAVAAEQAPADASEDEAVTVAEPADPNAPTHTLVDQVPEGAAGSVRLKDGSVVELTRFQKLGKFYFYISGKLNGRSSTAISFTRYQDVARWKTIMFKDKYNFQVITKSGKELTFLDSRIYIGVEDADIFTFYTTTRDLEEDLVDIRKDDVAAINFN